MRKPSASILAQPRMLQKSLGCVSLSCCASQATIVQKTSSLVRGLLFHDWAFTALCELSNLMCSSQCVVSCHLLYPWSTCGQQFYCCTAKGPNVSTLIIRRTNQEFRRKPERASDQRLCQVFFGDPAGATKIRYLYSPRDVEQKIAAL